MRRPVMEWRRPQCEASACIEVLEQYGSIVVRSSKRPEEMVVFDSDEWGTFIEAVKQGEFDL
jgi:hypothetical protein